MRRFRSKGGFGQRAVSGEQQHVTRGRHEGVKDLPVSDHDSVKAELIRLREAYEEAPEEKG